MVPVWIWTDLPKLLPSSSGHIAQPTHPASVQFSVMTYFLANGTVHFLQNVLAFVILARTSPVTYSIASLIKRVAVICAAVVWFAQHVHPVQAFGICLTFGGLYLYNRAVKKGDVDRGERKVRRIEKAWEGALPQTRDEVFPDADRVQVASVEANVAGNQMSHQRTPPTRPPLYSQSHPHLHPNLTIRIDPPTPIATAKSPIESKNLKEGAEAPTESYPSPPPSLDSPPATSGIEQGPWPVKRRGTLSGHGHNHAPAGIMEAPRVAAVGA